MKKGVCLSILLVFVVLVIGCGSTSETELGEQLDNLSEQSSKSWCWFRELS